MTADAGGERHDRRAGHPCHGRLPDTASDHA